ncbi:hypothetical protein M3Y98_01226300 [Aphelenchoides besseyi]|nr:hypothetical protein M3Y98_01226300 [Aphelenchoides besseyi]
MFESPPLCFALDQDSHEIVSFNGSQLSYQPILIIHRFSTIFWCAIGLALNMLLFTFTVAGYGRGISIVNSIIQIQNRTANSILLASTIAFTMGMWSYVTFMFIYRYHLIQHGTHPRRSRLIAYAFIPIFSAVFYTYCVLVTWKLENGTDERELQNSMKILHHFGYSLDVTEVRETDFNDPKSKLHFALFGLVMAVNSGIIIYCSLKIRQILRSGPVTSAATRRLNSDMDRVLLLNVCLPFLCNIVPTSFITKKIAECSYNPWSDLFCLTILDAYGHELVKFSNWAKDSENYLTVHLILNTVVALSALFLNGLLGLVIWKSRTNLNRLRGVFWYNCIIDLISATLNLLFAPYSVSGYHRVTMFANNGLHINNRSVLAIGLGATQLLVAICWSSAPIQFFIRYHVVSYGNRPNDQNFALALLFTVFSIFITAGVLLSPQNWFLFSSPRILDDSNRILRFAGGYVDVEAREVFPTNVPQNSIVSYLTPIFGLCFGLNYAFIIYFAYKIRSFLRNRMISANMRRMNTELNRFLASIAIAPLIINLPLMIAYAYISNQCEVNPMADLLLSLFATVAPAINPAISIFLISVYRRVFWSIIRGSRSNQTERFRSSFAKSSNSVDQGSVAYPRVRVQMTRRY